MHVRTIKPAIRHSRAIRLVNMALSLQYWRTYVDGSTKMSRKSEAMVEANRTLTSAHDIEMMVVEANVQAPMRDKNYRMGSLDRGVGLKRQTEGW
jgi:hypothetical protein